jgi:regulatory protein NPR1
METMSELSSSSYGSSIINSQEGPNLELLSLSKLSTSLEKLLFSTSGNSYSDAEIVVENQIVGVHRCLLAARSPFFEELFSNDDISSVKPKYQLSQLIPRYGGVVGFEVLMVILGYIYTGKLKPWPFEVSTCVDEGCKHDACFPAIDYAVQLMYASFTFQMKEHVLVVQRRLLEFVDKALAEDVIPIIVAAYYCELSNLLSVCVDRLARSNLDNVTLEKQVPLEIYCRIKSSRLQYGPKPELEENAMVKRIHKALDWDDVELVKKLVSESDTCTLDDACALHYAAAYCDPKVVTELVGLGMADLNRRNSRGYTVLHVAARRKDPSVIVGLLNMGACVSDTTSDGQTAVRICRRLTRPKDYNEETLQGLECNKDKLCIDVLEREMRRTPLAVNVSFSNEVEADELLMTLHFFENRVAFARVLFPREARLAMEIAHASSTSEFSGNMTEVDLNEKTLTLVSRLQALRKTVETGRRFFPNCSEVLDNFLQDDMPDAFFLEKGSAEERKIKKKRFMELKDDVIKAFHKDKAQTNRSLSTSSASPKRRLSVLKKK